MTMNNDAFWSIANALACAAIAYLVGCPRAQPGRRLSLRVTVARTLVASMAAAVCVSIIMHRYATPFEVVLNIAIAFAAYAQHGDIIADTRRTPDT